MQKPDNTVKRIISRSGMNCYANTSKQGIATIELAFNTKGRAQLNSLIEKIRQIDSVIDIERTTG